MFAVFYTNDLIILWRMKDKKSTFLLLNTIHYAILPSFNVAITSFQFMLK